MELLSSLRRIATLTLLVGCVAFFVGRSDPVSLPAAHPAECSGISDPPVSPVAFDRDRESVITLVRHVEPVENSGGIVQLLKGVALPEEVEPPVRSKAGFVTITSPFVNGNGSLSRPAKSQTAPAAVNLPVGSASARANGAAKREGLTGRRPVTRAQPDSFPAGAFDTGKWGDDGTGSGNMAENGNSSSTSRFRSLGASPSGVSRVPAVQASLPVAAPPSPGAAETRPANATAFIAGAPPVSPQVDLNRAGSFTLAEQPKAGEHFLHTPPGIDSRAVAVPPGEFDFSSNPCFGDTFDPAAAIGVYAAKQFQPTQRPAIEWFRPWYERGEIPASNNWFGNHNPDQFQLILSGDSRTGYASNSEAGNSSSLIASQLNLDFDMRFTSTERLHWFLTPLTQGAQNSRWLLDDDRFISELNPDVLFGYFEGDLGAIAGGLSRTTLPFDMPFAVGLMPLVIQNGVWMEDAIAGIATTVPARNMPRLGISNMDITFLFGFDQLDSPAFQGDDNAAKIYATMIFIEAWNGYVEADYAFLEDRNAALDRSYHNIAIGYTRRYGRLSNSIRVIANAGQSTEFQDNTADGVLLLSENSLVTSSPYSVFPYLNLFAGFDRPQSAARQGLAGGVLRNTGILFEPDNLTGYPTLDATANETFGAALGMNLMPATFSQQLVIETAFLQTMGDNDAERNAVGNQYGVGARYQLPISNSTLIRMDAMYGAFESSEDVHGARMELRKKF